MTYGKKKKRIESRQKALVKFDRITLHDTNRTLPGIIMYTPGLYSYSNHLYLHTYTIHLST